MTYKTCDKCQHFTADTHYKDTGACALMGDVNNFNFDFETLKLGIDPTKAYGSDYEGYSASVVVGPKFGCIHWAKKAAHGIKENT
jgi:hypothetical protein